MKLTNTFKLIILLALVAGATMALSPKTSPSFRNIINELLEELKKTNEERPEDRVYIHTDKPMYKPGETVWLSTYVREGASLKASKKSGIVHVELINPKGAVAKKISLIADNGQACGDFDISEEAPGGMYKVKAYTNWQKNDENPAYFVKELQVQKVVLPRLKMKLDFERETYGAGDAVKAELDLNTNANQPLANYTFDYVVNLAGQQLLKKNGTTNTKGEANITFDLPTKLESNDGILNVMIQYQGLTESISRSVPIVLNTIDLAFYPEGGDLVNGIKSRVAFKALNEFGLPADIEGKVLSSSGLEVADFSSYHQGMGAFEFTPLKGQSYQVQITKPEGVKAQYDVPEALKRGFALEVVEVTKDNIIVNTKSTENEELYVLANIRGENYYANPIKANSGDNLHRISTNKMPAGVAQLTLFDSKGIARAERLTFVNKHQELDINISTNKEKYQPREKVEMTIEVSDKRGVSMPADLSVAVADDQLLTFADDKSSNILSWLLMEADLAEEVEEPNFYFDKEEEKADLALDYLLMTSGWRRFTWEQIQEGLPVASYPAESNVLKGIVYGKNNKPLPNAVVKAGGIQRTTDENGQFLIEGVELYQPVDLAVNVGEYEVVRRASSYGKELTFRPNIKGRVLDESGEGLPFANVYIKGTRHGTTTDIDGNYELTIPADAPENPEIAVSYTGYSNQVVAINEASEINIKMEEGMMLNDVVVTRAGLVGRRASIPVRKKAKARPQVAMAAPPPPPVIEEVADEVLEEVEMIQMDIVDAEDLEELPVRNVNALEAQTAGVAKDDAAENVQFKGAREGDEAVFVDGVKIRGQASVVKKAEEEKARLVQVERVAKEEVRQEAKIANRRAEAERFAIGRAQDIRIRGDRIADKKPAPPRILYYRPREFPMPKYENKPVKTAQRTDFRSTIYWNGHVKVDRTGKAKLEFYTSDAITSFNITAEGIGKDGTVGRATHKFYSQLPFSMNTKIPVEVVTGDVLKLPVTFVNNTDAPLDGLLDFTVPKGFIPKEKLPEMLEIAANSTRTDYLEFLITKPQKKAKFGVQLYSNGFEDAVMQEITSVSEGFPAGVSFSNQELNETYPIDINDAVDGSIEMTLTAYPDIAGELMSGLESMLREPRGCFEQTSSATYPNILVLQYMQETDQINPEIAAKAKGLIARGYKRLAGYESKSGGFEWFGGDPGHEGLTAYGLMEFADMQKVWDGVDSKMIDRTVDWLMSRKDGNGLFKRNPRALHQFGLTDDQTMSAYITYGLTEAGYDGLKKEIELAYKEAMKADNPYLMGLTANILLNKKDKKRGNEVLAKLIKNQQKEGGWKHDNQHKSGPGSSGQALKIETAALALMALLKQDKANPEQIQKLSQFVRNSRGGYGGFGNTNSTVLALRSLIAHAKYAKQTQESGEIELYVNNKKVATKQYEAGTKGEIVLNDLAQYVKSGQQNVKVKFAGTKNALPYTLAVNWNTTLPYSDKECVIDLETTLAKKNAKVGETLRLTTELTNKTAEGQPMTIAIVGLPAGLTAQPWQLKELLDKKTVDFYEIIGNNVVFYYRQMAPSESKTIHLDLKAEMPGEFDAPASSAYLYYTNEFKDWDSVETVTIVQ